jgi:hypothetical protein
MLLGIFLRTLSGKGTSGKVSEHNPSDASADLAVHVHLLREPHADLVL